MTTSPNNNTETTTSSTAVHQYLCRGESIEKNRSSMVQQLPRGVKILRPITVPTSDQRNLRYWQKRLPGDQRSPPEPRTQTTPSVPRYPCSIRVSSVASPPSYPFVTRSVSINGSQANLDTGKTTFLLTNSKCGNATSTRRCQRPATSTSVTTRPRRPPLRITTLPKSRESMQSMKSMKQARQANHPPWSRCHQTGNLSLC